MPNNKKINRFKSFIYYVFLFTCMFPFILGNPFVDSDIQPYSLVFALFVCILNIKSKIDFGIYPAYFHTSLFLVLIAFLVFVASGISTSSFRGFYQYLSVFFIPLALIHVFRDFNGFPERFIKVCILIWFFVSSYQFFINRGFAESIMGNARWHDSSRGVIGLASEPSFFGLTCYFLLHLTHYFSNWRWIYTFIILLMGTVFAQSTLGIIFIFVYWVSFLLSLKPNRNSFLIVFATFVLFSSFIFILTTRLAGTRVFQLLTALYEEGLNGFEGDVSTEVRYNSLWGAIQGAFDNYLLPGGFGARIGSAYGGFMRELGFFCIPFLISFSVMMALTFKRKFVQIIYFIAFTVLFFNNTQMGHPILLMIIAANAFYGQGKQLVKL